MPDLYSPFYGVTSSTQINTLANAAYDRELELFTYEANLLSYDTLLTNELPTGDWDESIIAYKGANIEDVPDALLTLFVRYTFRDKVQNLYRSELAEKTKAAYVYTEIINQIIGLGGDPTSLLRTIDTTRNA